MFMSDIRIDKPIALGRMDRARPVRVIAVTSGKGGVGKTNVSANLAIALAGQGHEVMLMDADLGLANVDVLLGLHPLYNLSHVISGERDINDIVLTGPGGLRVIPAASGIKKMADLSPTQHAGIIQVFSDLTINPDVLLIDTAAGLSDGVTAFTKAAHEVIVVLCDEPASITDAYAMIKVMNREHGIHRFRVLANMTRMPQQGADLFNKIIKVTNRFLDVTLDYMGAVPHDEYLLKAVQKRRAVVDAYPRSKSAIAFKNLALKVANWPVPDIATGSMEFFVERLIRANQAESLV
jgi:flagellar biosynthesis protein FlhG